MKPWLGYRLTAMQPRVSVRARGSIARARAPRRRVARDGRTDAIARWAALCSSSAGRRLPAPVLQTPQTARSAATSGLESAAFAPPPAHCGRRRA